MKRRRFLWLAGGAAAWSVAAQGQRGMPVVGFLDSGSSTGMSENLAAFRRGLGELGYNEGQNVAVEYRWAEGHYDQLPAMAAELARRPVAVIAATRSPAPGLAAKGVTSTVPIVFQSGGDPVKDGLVPSLGRPGGNVTGVTRLSTVLIPKRLELLLELVPKVTSIALLVDPGCVQAGDQVLEMQEAAGRRGLQLHIVRARTAGELGDAFSVIEQSQAGALVVATSPLLIASREQIVALAMKHMMPTMFGEREPVVAGGLMSYAASLSDSFRQVGVLVGRILKGARPEDLPVQQPVKFELVINQRTAQALGVAIPPALLASADEVID